MQNIPQEQSSDLAVNQPRSIQTKSSNKIINNRYINQNIYKMFLQKRYDECLKFISKCQEDEFKIYIKALIAKNQFKLDKALDYFSQCQMLDRSNFHYLKHMAKTFILVGKYKSGLEAAKDAMKFNNNDPQIHYILAKLSLALQDRKNALVYYDLSLTKQKNQAAFVQKARLLYQDRKFDEALTVLQSATEFSSQNAQVYELIGEIKYNKGNVESAIENYRKALEIDSLRFNTLLSLGSLSQAKQQADEAFEFYKKAHKISPNSAALWNNIAVHMFEKKKTIAAYSCFKRALFLDPFRWDIHANLGLLFMKNKKYLQAEIHFKSAVKIKNDGVLFNLWGICLRNLKDTKNAQACFQQGYKLQPHNQQIRYNLILAMKQNKKQEEARKQFKAFMQQVHDPKIKRALYQVKDRFQ